MFVYPHDGLLHFGRAIPRAWFAQTQPFSATDVVTEFGKAGVTYTADPKTDTARAVVTLDQARARSRCWCASACPRRDRSAPPRSTAPKPTSPTPRAAMWTSPA